jgi:hypothetical protein
MALFIVLFLLMRPVLKGTTALFTVLFVLLRPVLKGKGNSQMETIVSIQCIT